LITLTLTAADLPGASAENGPMSPRSDRPRRRSFTAQYKLDILTEYDAADPAARGALLRRGGLVLLAFGSLADARAFCETFFAYYNHRHSGIALHSPASVHFGTAGEIRAQRAVTFDAAYAAHPDRFRADPSRPSSPTPRGSTSPAGRPSSITTNAILSQPA
jgi:hypothetical protein